MNHGRVLVVEDDPSIRTLIRSVLEGRGYEVFEAVDGPSAHPTALEVRPDAVLLDIGLPGLDGFGVLGLLKDDAELNAIPVLMVTAWAEPELITKALDRGAHDFVRKPFNVGELGARVDAAVRVTTRQDAILVDNERLSEIATIDPLTSLVNRYQLMADLERQVSLARRSNTPFSLVMLDLDRFKSVNDTHGHAVGDDLLGAVARRLTQRLRGSDVLARWGGEEFVVLAPGADLGGAGALAEDLRCALAESPFDTSSVSLRTTGSFGVAEFGDESGEALLARADAALYEAKAGGRNAVRLATNTPVDVPAAA